MTKADAFFHGESVFVVTCFMGCQKCYIWLGLVHFKMLWGNKILLAEVCTEHFFFSFFSFFLTTVAKLRSMSMKERPFILLWEMLEI